MAATLIVSVFFFSLAVLGLSLGVIFKKRTPLKGECHGPVDGGGSCATCAGGHVNSCDVSDGGTPNQSGRLTQTQQAFAKGNFSIEKVSADKISLRR